ncbi:PKD domain-containing protein [Pseudoalteromonas sp. C2R02]|uniref:PKD domain-containing protein n=1 Tax=Pseudoalteromonas sp. C2R02 TaxID=2841565 RepID=UPI001C08B08C|nr:PKD domain-containing protein [Pseudoalteromonas sp. C2R02]MBU2971440.1 PKD domain-containing protein [Pseudoalteromonas sp. C2R02]
MNSKPNIISKAFFATLMTALSTGVCAATTTANNSVSEQKVNISDTVSYIAIVDINNKIKTIHHADASFIKVNFTKLSLPLGAYIEVANENESYRYEAIDLQNGAEFSAMSISADTLTITLVLEDDTQWQSHHGVEIKNYSAGYSDFELAEHNLAYENTGTFDNSILSTCGVNERRDVACWQQSNPVEYERSRPVARLLIGGRSLCTAWRVGPNNHMFTNNHCIESAAEASQTEVWFDYQRTQCAFGSAKAPVKVMANQLLSTEATLDYTLFTVNDFAKIKQFGHFGLDINPQVQGQRIYIPQHGAGNPKELSIISDKNASGMCEIDQTKTTGRGYNTDAGYYCDTTGGSSGSPVLSAKTNKVVALHHLGGCPRPDVLNRGARMELIWPKVANFFANVPPQGDNVIDTNQPPIAKITYQCDLKTCQFNSTDSIDPDGQIIDVKWDLGDGNTSNSLSLSHTYQTEGQYQISLTVTDNEGAQAGTAISINVTDLDALPVADFSYSKSGLQVSFINTSTDDIDITRANWAFGDGQTALTKDSQNTYSQPGSYDVTLTVSDSAGQQSSITKTITVTDGQTTCNGINDWSAQKVYLKGDQVAYLGAIYQANWWTKNQTPKEHSGNWQEWSYINQCN